MSTDRLTWHNLVGRRVVDSEGATVGHVVDLVAEADDEARVVIAAILVGPRALLGRIASAHWADRHAPRLEVPWASVAGVGDDICLHVRRDQVMEQGRTHP